jgi:methionyl-tRNA formyltransferase
VAEPQDSAAATTAPPIDREHGRIRWEESANTIHDLVRGLAPRPGATTVVRGKQLRVTKTRRVAAAPPLAPGELRVERPRILVGTGNGALELIAAQLEGKREMPALDLANGRALIDGERLGVGVHAG